MLKGSSFLLGLSLLAFNLSGQAPSWTQLANPAPDIAPGTMMLLTDGTVIVQESDAQHWMRLTPDSHGSYINGSWTTNPESSMTTPRLFFASQVLPSGKVWVLGGEYSGLGLPNNETGTSEIFDPIANTWTATSSIPANGGFAVTQFGCVVTAHSGVISQIGSTAGWQVGWMVSGYGIAPNAVITSIDSSSQIHVSPSSYATTTTALSLGIQATGNTTSRSNLITGIPSTAGWQPGFFIAGPGIPDGSYILSVDSATSVHLTQSATATGTGVALSLEVVQQEPNAAGDAPSILLGSGKVMVGDNSDAGTFFYNYLTNTWSAGPSSVYSRTPDDSFAEESFARLADGTVIAYDIGSSLLKGSSYAERYNPVTNQWSGISPADHTANGTLPALSNLESYELGPQLRLYDDRMLVLGATGHTGLYTPSTNTWAAGPDMLGQLGGSSFLWSTDDAPGAILPNGHVIFAADAGNGIVMSGTTTAGSSVIKGLATTAQLQLGWSVIGAGIPDGATIAQIGGVTVTMTVKATASGTTDVVFGGPYSNPTELFDFDPAANTIAPVSPALPDDNLPILGSWQLSMLMLPNGQLLVSDSTNQLWIYTPSGNAAQPLLPVITGVSSNGAGVFTLSGVQLTGQSAGAAYGDDIQMDENYPIVSFVNASQTTYYARTTNWSYIGVAGTAPQTVNFTLNPQMPGGTYQLFVSAAGIRSSPVTATVSADVSTVTVPAVSAPSPAITSVVNGYNSTAPLSPGAIALISGSNFGNAAANVSVYVGFKLAYVYPASVSPSQLQIEIPMELSASTVPVTVMVNGMPSNTFYLTLAAYAPTCQPLDSSGSGLGKILTSSSNPVTLTSPAHSGDSLTLTVTGLGATNPATPTGLATADTSTALLPTLSIGGVTAPVAAAVLVSGAAGVYRIDFTVPAGEQGTQPLVIGIGGTPSSTSCTIPLAGLSSIVSNASFGNPGVVSPGSIATAFANILGTSTDELAGLFPATSSEGVKVTFNGEAAPMFHIVASTAQQQVDLLVPTDLPTSGTVNVQLNGYPISSVTMVPANPGLYRIPDPKVSTRLNVIAQFANTAWLALPVSTTTALGLPACASNTGALVVCGQPATPGDYLVIYVTGLGAATVDGVPGGAQLQTGQIAPASGSPLYKTPTLPAVTVGGVSAQVLFSGLAPGFSGLYQIDIQVPSGTPAGDDVPVKVTMLGASDSATISVQQRSN